jgi:hypothetical protein
MGDLYFLLSFSVSLKLLKRNKIYQLNGKKLKCKKSILKMLKGEI